MFSSNRLPVRHGPGPAKYVLIRLPRISRSLLLHLGFLAAGILLALGFRTLKDNSQEETVSIVESSLFLLDQAILKVPNAMDFEQKVRRVSAELGIAPEWLMSVMYAESGFDPAIANRKGSGAVGLIQFMPATAQELGITPLALANMNPVQQLDYVSAYFSQVQTRYGPYTDLTDLYLAVLYPKARKKDYCYTLYARPTQAYRQNAGLDENRDGRVTVSDIHRRMLRLFPEAYLAQPKTNAFSS